MALTREAVIWGYIYFLGREPESEEIIRTHMRAKDESSFAEDLIRSSEFNLRRRFSNLIQLKVPPQPPPPQPHTSTSEIRMAILGNCQVESLAMCIQALSGNISATSMELTPRMLLLASKGEMTVDLASMVSDLDILLVHPLGELAQSIEKMPAQLRAKVQFIPKVGFSAFHPDLIYVEKPGSGERIKGPLIGYNSSLVYYGWTRGMSASEILELFTDEVYQKLGFYEFWTSARDTLLNEGISCGLPLDHLFDSWTRRGCFMHSVNHPKLFVIADLARAILNRLDIDTIPGAEHYVEDMFANAPAWPVYPEIGQRLGIEGNYLFKMHRSSCPHDKPVLMLDLEGFVKASLKEFSRHRKDDFVCTRDLEPYRQLDTIGSRRRFQKPAALPEAYSTKPSTPDMPRRTPYDGLPNYRFWRKAIEGVPLGEVDPVVSSDFTLDRRTKIATAGSCFAQHMSGKLRQHGFNYYIAEKAAGLSFEEAARLNYGVFSARYGNIYTARQLIQLFDRAFGAYHPAEKTWRRRDGRYADPFRPRIEPDGFASPEAVELSREAHLASVREMFENLDVLVFTLGLTEAWRSREDGAVFPLAPGVAAGEMDFARYEFINFQTDEVAEDLEELVQKLAAVNGRARIIFTVSPVPLIATYEDRHVLLSTTYSKSVLRVAAEMMARRHKNCIYFPSYEIITGNYTQGVYYMSDLRSVTDAGVDHVMRLFFAHYTSEKEDSTRSEALKREFEGVQEIICDEEELAAAAS